MNTIEDHDDHAVRGLLNAAFGAVEPPFADLASGSIARGDAARRRNRLYTASGVVLSMVAVVGTFAAVNSAAPTPASRPGQTAATPTAAAPTDLAPTSAHGLPTVAKNLDLLKRVPAALQPLLPAGATVTAPSRDYGPMTSSPGFLLTRQSGTTLAHLQLGRAPSEAKNDRMVGCSQGWSCQTKQVADGTVYVQTESFTAERQVGDYEAKALKPGTEKAVVGKSAILTFIPADRTKPTFSITESTQIAALQYADKPPAQWGEGNPWPPIQFPAKSVFDAAGVLLSADDFAAMVADPGLDKVEKELDTDTPVSQDTLNMLAGQASQVAAAGAAVLPAGTKLSLDLADMGPRLLLSGATGSNEISWQMHKQDPSYVSQTLTFHAPNVDTTTKPVPGGKLMSWVQYPTTSNLVKTSNTPSEYDYYFFPDDTAKPAVSVGLKTLNSMTGANSPLQLTADQFLALAADPQLQTAIDKTTAVVTALR